MRLWHYKLIPILDNQRLLSQHRECCALRGLGWGRKHSTVDYVFKHNFDMLVCYHYGVLLEMNSRGYKINPDWYSYRYRGKITGWVNQKDKPNMTFDYKSTYPEHDESYYQECIELLLKKNYDYYKNLLED